MPSSLTLRVVNQSISWTRPLSNSSPSGSRKDWRVVARPSAAPPRPCSGCVQRDGPGGPLLYEDEDALPSEARIKRYFSTLSQKRRAAVHGVV
jgi:hypothetical protein